MSTEYAPPTPPAEPGFYWAYPIWQFGSEYQMIVFVSGNTPKLVATDVEPGPGLYWREIIPHDILRWGPRVEFPQL